MATAVKVGIHGSVAGHDAVTIPWNARCQLARTVVPVAHNTDLVMNFVLGMIDAEDWDFWNVPGPVA